MKRVFKIDIETCDHCGGAVKVIASMEDPAVIKQILEHLARRAQAAPPAFRPFARAPPPALVPGLTEPGWQIPTDARTRGWIETRHGVARVCQAKRSISPGRKTPQGERPAKFRAKRPSSTAISPARLLRFQRIRRSISFDFVEKGGYPS